MNTLAIPGCGGTGSPVSGEPVPPQLQLISILDCKNPKASLVGEKIKIEHVLNMITK